MGGRGYICERVAEKREALTLMFISIGKRAIYPIDIEVKVKRGCSPLLRLLGRLRIIFTLFIPQTPHRKTSAKLQRKHVADVFGILVVLLENKSLEA